MSKRTAAKPYWKMNAEELARATVEFDREMPLEAGRPLSLERRAKWEKAKRRGRPRIGKGAVRVLISIEAGLLDEADAFADRHGLTRSQLIARGLQSVMRAPGVNGRSPGERPRAAMKR